MAMKRASSRTSRRRMPRASRSRRTWPTTSGSRTGRSPTWPTSTTAGRSTPSSTRSWIEAEFIMATYDFIVVGTGAGGACVANRLSENPDAKVLVLEAGPAEIPADVAPNVSTPYLWYMLLGSKVDWCYETVPQPGLEGRVIHEPRGKIPG